MPSPVMLARRQLAWGVLLDLPVRLSSRQDANSGPAYDVILWQQDLADDGTEPGWLVMLSVSNSGWSPIRCSDFATPPSFSFPGRRVLAASLSTQPAARKPPGPHQNPAMLVAGETPDSPASTAGPSSLQLAGHFLLRPTDSYSITVVLSGTPIARSGPPVLLNSALPGGKVTACR